MVQQDHLFPAKGFLTMTTPIFLVLFIKYIYIIVYTVWLCQDLLGLKFANRLKQQLASYNQSARKPKRFNLGMNASMVPIYRGYCLKVQSEFFKGFPKRYLLARALVGKLFYFFQHTGEPSNLILGVGLRQNALFLSFVQKATF